MFILIVTNRPTYFADFQAALADQGVDVGLTTTARAALVHAKIEPPTLAVVDETLPDATPFSFIAQLAQTNPGIQTAVVSRLSPAAFHKAGEGLGILTSLPPHPKAEDACKLHKALAH